MYKFNLITPKTARIFSLGEISRHTKNIWIVLHGYAYHAKYFLKKFECLEDKQTVVFAPEGLNRFYKDGLTGKVGASWMTKEDRENEIKDYINYLDNLYEYIENKSEDFSNVKINVLGFSQGVATQCRWLAHKKSKADNIIIWASNFPHDFDYENDVDIFHQANNIIVYGLQDPFLNGDHIEVYEKLLNKHKIKHQLLTFEGKHEINEALLLEIKSKL